MAPSWKCDVIKNPAPTWKTIVANLSRSIWNDGGSGFVEESPQDPNKNKNKDKDNNNNNNNNNHNNKISSDMVSVPNPKTPKAT